jgi:hypothetical protein
MLNNNHVISVEVGEELNGEDEEWFDTGFVDVSFAATANFSKSLNDIHTQNIPQNGLRPNSFANFQCDELFLSVSMRPGVAL